MRPNPYTLGTYTGADADSIALAQAVAANTPMALSGVLGGTLDVPRTVQLTFAGNETGNRFSIKGTSHKGSEQWDTVAGNNAGTVESREVFKTVIEIVPERAGAGNVSAGTVVGVPTPWYPLDYIRDEFNARVNVIVTGTLATGYSIQAYAGKIGRLTRGGVATRFDLVGALDPLKIMDITEGGTPVLVSSFGQILAPCTAVRLKCLEALGANESIFFEVLQGH